MCSGIITAGIVAGLPPRRNSCDPAERDEHKCLQSAVSLEVLRAVLARALDSDVTAHIGIEHVLRDVVINSARLLKRRAVSFRDFRSERFHERRENGFRQMLGDIFLRRGRKDRPGDLLRALHVLSFGCSLHRRAVLSTASALQRSW